MDRWSVWEEGCCDIEVQFVCFSISCNEFVAKQNWSSNLVFLQLACLPRRAYESKSHASNEYYYWLPAVSESWSLSDVLLLLCTNEWWQSG